MIGKVSFTHAADIKEYYDVVIIGAGIAGLVSGNLLAKTGYKVLILEKHYLVGGCCQTFKRKNYYFDAGVHALGGMSKGGYLKKIYDEFDLSQFIHFHRIEPSDVVITKDFEISYYSDENLKKTIDQYRLLFPEEEVGIADFFSEISKNDILYFWAKYRDITFQNYLDKFFKEEKLKNTFLMFLWNVGVSAKDLLCPTGVALFKNFVLDGGWYPDGGMQNFSNALANSFIRYGGSISILEEVKEIENADSLIKRIITNRTKTSSKFVISNTSAMYLYNVLLKKQKINNDLHMKINMIKPSPSAFMYFLAIKNDERFRKYKGANLWIYDEINLGDSNQITNDDILLRNKSFYCAIPSQHDQRLAPENEDVVCVAIPAFWESDEYWIKNRPKWEEHLLRLFDEKFPGVQDKIVHKESATPMTIKKFTSNDFGAIYGAKMIPEQDGLNKLSNRTGIEGLYHVGHWTKPGAGVSIVAMSGYSTAKEIIRYSAVNERSK